LFNHDSDFFAFDHHGLVVGADAASLEPRITKNLVEHGHKLTKMGGSFDGRTSEAKVFRHFVIVDGQMAVVFLVA
jgi:hypothetical protein